MAKNKVVNQKGPKPRPKNLKAARFGSDAKKVGRVLKKTAQAGISIPTDIISSLVGKEPTAMIKAAKALEAEVPKMEKGGKVVNQKGPRPRPRSGMMNEDMGRMIDPNTEISDEEAARLLRMARMAKRGKNYAEGGEVNRDLGGFILDSYLGGVRQKDLKPQKIGSPPAKKSSSGATMPGRGGKFKGTK
jgi:hypothetical protein